MNHNRKYLLLALFLLVVRATRAWQSPLLAPASTVIYSRYGGGSFHHARALPLYSSSTKGSNQREAREIISLNTNSDNFTTPIHYMDLDDRAVPELQRRLQLQIKHQETIENEDYIGENRQLQQQLVQVEGYLTSLRQFGPSFCFLDLSKNGVSVPVQAMLKRQEFKDPARFDGCMKSLVPGIRIVITGSVGPTRNAGEALVLIHDIRIQKLPRNPQHVRKLLRLVSEGLLEAKDLVQAANKTEEELIAQIERSKQATRPNHPKAFNGLAKALLENLKEDHDNDMEYPDLSMDQSLLYSLPEAPAEIRFAPDCSILLSSMQQSAESSSKIKKFENNNEVETLSIQDVIMGYDRSPRPSNTALKEETLRVTGWVQNRRRFRNFITALEVVDKMVPVGTESDDTSVDSAENTATEVESATRALNDNREVVGNSMSISPRVKCVLHPNVFQSTGNSTHTSELYGHLLAPGCCIRMTGFFAGTSIGDENNDDNDSANDDVVAGAFPIFWVRKIDLLEASWRPSVVQFLLEEVVAGNFELEEAAQSLKISSKELGRIVATDDLTKRQWQSADIARRLQRQAMDGLHVDHEALKAVENFEKLRGNFPLTFVDAAAAPDVSRSDFVSTQGSRWKRKKEPQLEWMSEQVKGVLDKSFAADRFRIASSNGRPLRILDVGGGKGFLANHLARRLLDGGYTVEILVLDVAEGAVHNGRLRTERQNLSHVVTYAVTDASTVDLGQYGDVDLVVALHACGVLTDVALGHAVSQQAAFVICPCCFLSNSQLLVPTVARQGDKVLTQDRLAAKEWLDVDSEAYEKIKGLAEIQGDLKLANRAIHTLCALRLTAVQSRASVPMNVSIRTFPVAFSTRNFCLVGTTQEGMAQ